MFVGLFRSASELAAWGSGRGAIRGSREINIFGPVVLTNRGREDWPRFGVAHVALTVYDTARR
jgi:hypothetical protein